MTSPLPLDLLITENEDLRARLAEAEETLSAIHNGEVDALVVSGPTGEQIFTLKGADYPYRVLIEEMGEGALTLTLEGVVFYANRRFAKMIKTPLEQVIGSAFDRWVVPADRWLFAELQRTNDPQAHHYGEIILLADDGTTVPCYLSLNCMQTEEIQRCFCLVVTDLTEQKRSEALLADITERRRIEQALRRSEALLKLRLRLFEVARTGSLDDLLRMALDCAESLTGSQISFFHFVEPDQNHLTLQTWSTNTMKVLCTAAGKGLHYPIDQAGVWADCVDQRQTIIHNDYASLPNRKGLPEGHAPVIRELTTPLLDNDNHRVSAILGVGNKPEDYDDYDVEAIQQLATMTMEALERQSAAERIAHLAFHDALTHLPNRELLSDRLHLAMAQARRDQKRLAVCYLDMDGFKPINDTWGHVHGDGVLIEIAQRLKSSLRAGDTVARLGGDEFVLLLGNLNNQEECRYMLDRIMTVLELPFSVAGQLARLTASLGVALYPDDEADPDTLIRHSDQAMYAAKQAGGNRYQLFDPDQDRRVRKDRDVLQRIQAGLATGEFRLYYQPKVNMREGVVIGAEALIRWQHPTEGLLPPAHFITVVDNSELARVMGQWVLNEALRQMTVWAAQGLRLPVSVNLSGRHLQQPDFTAHLSTLLADYPTVPPCGLQLEILETATLDNIALVSALIADCRQLGVGFALDDFGTGYSSLTYLKHLPVDILKIDQSFVRDLLADSEALAIVKGVIGLSDAFHRQVIAEGVETVEHGRRLLELGCCLAQGYGIARPMPPEQIPDWITGWRSPDIWSKPHRNAHE